MSLLSGQAGLFFNITESATTNVTGAVTQIYQVATTVGSINLTTTDSSLAMYGYVGANSYQLNLRNISNVSGAGTGIAVTVARNQAVLASNIKYVIVHNADSTNNITIKAGATSSFLPAAEQITLKAGQAVGMAYSNSETVGATSSVMSIVGSAASTYHEIFVIYN